MVKKIPEFIPATSPAEHKDVEACVVWCIDPRFRRAYRKLLEALGLREDEADLIMIPGGAKALMSPAAEEERTILLGQIETSVIKHHPTLIVATTHTDCAAYAGLAGGFKGDASAEREFHMRGLRSVLELLRSNFPGVEVRTAFVGFDGIRFV